MAWKADHIQGVVFPLPGTKQSSALELWRLIMPNREPEAFQGAGSSPIGQTHASGVIDDLQIILSTQLGRIDIQIAPASDISSGDRPPQIEDIAATLSRLQTLMQPVLELGRTARIATVVQLSKDFEQQSQATAFLNEKSGSGFPAESTDNIYQFNVRKSYASAGGTEMNRVVTWSSGAKQLFSGQIDISSAQFGMTAAYIIPIAALKIDLNSATNRDISSQAVEMLAEHCEEIQSLLFADMESFRARH